MPPARPDPVDGTSRLGSRSAALSSPANGSPPGDVPAQPPARDRSVTEQWLQRANELAAGSLPGQAVRPYRELLELEPGHVEGRLHFARLLDRLEEATEAVDVLSEGLRRTPDQTEFLVLRGAILGRLQRYREAEIDLRRVLRLHPSHAPAQFELGLLLWRRGLVQEAASSFHRALEFQPDSAKTYYYLGDALNQLGDLPGHARLFSVRCRSVRATPRPTTSWAGFSTG